MKRNSKQFLCKQPRLFKQKMLSWIESFSIFCFMDSNEYKNIAGSYDFIAAAGSVCTWNDDAHDRSGLQQFIQSKKDWLFGHFNFEWQHPVLGIEIINHDISGFQPVTLFQPLHIIHCQGDFITISSLTTEPAQLYEAILHLSVADNKGEPNASIKLQAAVNREKYLKQVEALRKHIHRGDCYEINYCIEFLSLANKIAPVAVYKKLCELSPAPMSCLYRNADAWLICSSPERFITKKNDTVFSQPIKGTIQRNPVDQHQDERLKEQLQNSSKDQVENVMIVDLVRNDLSRFCLAGSVQVQELFGLYSFPHLHQLISTITGRVDKEIAFEDVIKACFPMGSMTGAPKRKVLELIHQYESGCRGIFSGTVGYISPENNFDWNVVIRSIMYNESTGYVGYKVGSGITFYSNPEQEYEECMLKAYAMQKVLS